MYHVIMHIDRSQNIDENITLFLIKQFLSFLVFLYLT